MVFVNSPCINHLVSELIIYEVFTTELVRGLCTHTHTCTCMHTCVHTHARMHVHTHTQVGQPLYHRLPLVS